MGPVLRRWISVTRRALRRRRDRGIRAERYAARFLRRNGLHILRRNYRCRAGEIDLVALDRGWVVFVEVKYIGAGETGWVWERIDREKTRRLEATAMAYLVNHGVADVSYRFDVVAVRGPGRRPRVRWYVNALPG